MGTPCRATLRVLGSWQTGLPSEPSADLTHLIELIEARPLAEHAFASASKGPATLVTLGIVLTNMKDTDAAARHFESALAIDPANARLHNQLANLHSKRKAFECVSSFEQAIRLAPEDVGYRVNLERFPKAWTGQELRTLHRFRGSDSRRTHILPKTAIASARDLSGDLAGAIFDHATAIRLDPNYADAYGSRGKMLMDAGRFDEAAADFAEHVWLRPEAAVGHYGYATALIESGQPRQAILSLRKVEANFPDDVTILDALGLALYRADRYEDALAVYDRLASLRPYCPW